MHNLPELQKTDPYFGEICKYVAGEIVNQSAKFETMDKSFVIKDFKLYRVHTKYYVVPYLYSRRATK